MKSKCQLITATGAFTFNVPAGVSLVRVTLVAGGGGSGAGAASTNCSGAGGAGEYAYDVPVSVTPGGTVSGSVAAGGVGAATSATNGLPGGDTSFGSLSVQGGFGGLSVTAGTSGNGGGIGGAVAGSPAAGHIGTREQVMYWGGACGGNGGTSASAGSGNGGWMPAPIKGTDDGVHNPGPGGASSPWGFGGNGGQSNVTATLGHAPASDAYGASAGGSPGLAGQAPSGANGMVLVTWVA